MNIHLRRFISAIFLPIIAIAIGCGENRDAGQQLEDAADRATNRAEDAVDATQNAAEDAVDATQDAAEDAGEALEDAVDQ